MICLLSFHTSGSPRTQPPQPDTRHEHAGDTGQKHANSYNLTCSTGAQWARRLSTKAKSFSKEEKLENARQTERMKSAGNHPSATPRLTLLISGLLVNC